MIISDEQMKSVPFSTLRPGDVWMCPQTREWFVKVSHDLRTTGLNCVRLTDGALKSHAHDTPVDFYNGASLQIP